MTMAKTRRNRERGAALLEAAFTIPILLLIAVGIFEFGRAYQFWQVLTNAAREAARYSVTPNATEANAQAIAVQYMDNGGVTGCTAACVTVNRNVPLATGTGSNVSIAYPFTFIVIQPISQLVTGGAGVNNTLTMSATATMRNEGS
jgi:Flp pilus assembly protein TadG